MSSVVNSVEFLHKQLENMCSHKEVTRDTPLLCRKTSVMQKNYAENFLLCRKIFCYAEKLYKKFSCMQKKLAFM